MFQTTNQMMTNFSTVSDFKSSCFDPNWNHLAAGEPRELSLWASCQPKIKKIIDCNVAMEHHGTSSSQQVSFLDDLFF